jgi:hypothetical protein
VLLCYNKKLSGSDDSSLCGSGGTGRHTIYLYRFRNSLQTSDNKPSTFRLNHFGQYPSERAVDASKPRMQAVGAKSGAIPLNTKRGALRRLR